MPVGIRNKVVILGMGCSRFGERWDAGPEDLMVEAYAEAMDDAGIDQEQLDAAWFSTHMDDVGTGRGGTPMSIALRLPNIGVTRVENFCAGGSEAVRGAVYAVASGACDIAIALGVEKLKDTGYAGLPMAAAGSYIPLWYPSAVAPANFAQLAAGYRGRHGIDESVLKRALAHISVKSHANALVNPKAHLRKAITEDQCLHAPIIAAPLGLFDCCGVSDGAAAVIVATPDVARGLGKKNPVAFKALQIVASNGWEMQSNEWDGSYVHTTRIAAARAYQEAGIEDPRGQLSLTEVHDCFSITELVTMEDLGLSDPGCGYRDVLEGVFDADGALPCQVDGGLKCFGHPIGASGIRMLYEVYLQLQGRAGARQMSTPALGLVHNLGGQPSQNVCAVSIVGLWDA